MDPIVNFNTSEVCFNQAIWGFRLWLISHHLRIGLTVKCIWDNQIISHMVAKKDWFVTDVDYLVINQLIARTRKYQRRNSMQSFRKIQRSKWLLCIPFASTASRKDIMQTSAPWSSIKGSKGISNPKSQWTAKRGLPHSSYRPREMNRKRMRWGCKTMIQSWIPTSKRRKAIIWTECLGVGKCPQGMKTKAFLILQ